MKIKVIPKPDLFLHKFHLKMSALTYHLQNSFHRSAPTDESRPLLRCAGPQTFLRCSAPSGRPCRLECIAITVRWSRIWSGLIFYRRSQDSDVFSSVQILSDFSQMFTDVHRWSPMFSDVPWMFSGFFHDVLRMFSSYLKDTSRFCGFCGSWGCSRSCCSRGSGKIILWISSVWWSDHHGLKDISMKVWTLIIQRNSMIPKSSMIQREF